MGWIDLVKDRDRCLAHVNPVMNVFSPKIRGISWFAEDLLVSQ
jgi:hypothetical protein